MNNNGPKSSITMILSNTIEKINKIDPNDAEPDQTKTTRAAFDIANSLVKDRKEFKERSKKVVPKWDKVMEIEIIANLLILQGFSSSMKTEILLKLEDAMKEKGELEDYVNSIEDD